MMKLLSLLLLCTAVAGYPTGAPPTRCENMTPAHGLEQAGANPYSISVSASRYVPGGTLTVTINGRDFKGLILQARRVGWTAAVGTFSLYPVGTKALSCQAMANSAVTHSDTSVKPAGTAFTWTAPADLTGEIEFIATVATDKLIWWKSTKSYKVDKDGNSPSGVSATIASLSVVLLIVGVNFI